MLFSSLHWSESFVNRVGALALAVFALLPRTALAADGYLAQFGHPSTWGTIGSIEHLGTLESILEARKAYATSIVRTDVYVEQHESGGALGGQGDGTPGNPYRCRTTFGRF